MESTPIEERMKRLEQSCEVMERAGNWNYDAYMQGLANGLILARHTMRDDPGEPPLKSPPEKWLRDVATHNHVEPESEE